VVRGWSGVCPGAGGEQHHSPEQQRPTAMRETRT
jgi:hypothetical protein